MHQNTTFSHTKIGKISDLSLCEEGISLPRDIKSYSGARGNILAGPLCWGENF